MAQTEQILAGLNKKYLIIANKAQDTALVSQIFQAPAQTTGADH